MAEYERPGESESMNTNRKLVLGGVGWHLGGAAGATVVQGQQAKTHPG
jgi:hypothetical protein